MKIILSLAALLALLFVGGFLWSGLTPPQVVQIEMTKEVELPKEQPKETPNIVTQPVAPAPTATPQAE